MANLEFAISVVDFRLLAMHDPYDLKWGWWSRVFEYEKVLETLDQLGGSEDASVHNTCWGWHGSHVLFKDSLDRRFSRAIHSDLRSSTRPGTFVYDVSTRCPAEWVESFDFVINVSTLEEVEHSHIEVFGYLLEMVKPGGHLIVTFDLPGLQLEAFESLFGMSLKDTDEAVTGANSPYPMDEYADLRVGYFVVRRR